MIKVMRATHNEGSNRNSINPLWVETEARV
jgi:hypothetical protein